jgi:drug/metabolite transporter (DMT)-like permease
MFLLIILYMLFASTFTIGKAALSYTTPILFIGMRMIIGGILLLGYQYFFNYKALQYRRTDWKLLAQVSFFQYYAAFILEFVALQWMTSGKASLFWNFSPFITALLCYFLLGERLSYKKTLGLIIGFLGLLPILVETTPQEELVGMVSWFSIPEIILMGAVASAGYGWIVFAKAQEQGYNTVTINGLSMTAAGIAALLTSFVIEGAPHIMPPASCLSKNMPALCHALGGYGAGIALFFVYSLALIVISNIICFNLYGYLLTVYSATFVSFAGFITPLFAAFFGYLFLHEHIGPSFIYSVVIVFIGLVLFFQEELKGQKSP